MQMPRNPKRSKRSSKVALTTMALIGGGAALSACGSEPAAPAAKAAEDKTEVQVFENVFTCAKVTGKTRDECEDMRNEALAKAEKEAPRFEAIEDCEAEYGAGQCVENGVGKEDEYQTRRSYSGFVVAWFSSGKNNAPLFKSGPDGYKTSNGSRLSYGNAPGKYYASSRAMERPKTVNKVKPASKLAKAGGFGGRSTGGWNVSDRDGKSGKTAAGGSTNSRSKGG